MKNHTKTLQNGLLLCLLWMTGLEYAIISAHAKETPKPDSKGSSTPAASSTVKSPAADPESLFLQAKALAKGSGVPKDELAAFNLYLKAAEQGHAKAQHNLAVMYFDGVGVTKSATEAAKWFRKAAQQGTVLSQVCLGIMLTKGDGVPRQDIKEAVQWYEKAAEQGSLDAMQRLGEIYYFGDQGLPQDYALAAKYFTKAADLGGPAAQNFLGTMHDFGWGVSKDHALARTLYGKAAEQGYAKAQANYGMCYTHEDWEKYDPVEAYKWLKLSADQGTRIAEVALRELTPPLTEEQIKEGELRIEAYNARTSQPAATEPAK